MSDDEQLDEVEGARGGPDGAEEAASSAAAGAATGAADGVASGSPEAAAAGAAGGGASGVAGSVPGGEAGQAAAQTGAGAIEGAASGDSPAGAATGAAAGAAGAGAGAASGAMAEAGVPPEVASAGASAASGGLGAMAEAVVEAVAGERALPRTNYSFEAPDGPEALWMVRGMHFSEALSEPYSLSLDLVTEELGVDTEQMLGASCELLIDREDIVRTVCGVVTLVEFIGVSDDRLQIRVEVAPALHLLSQRVDTRLWQNITVPDVVREVLEAGLADYEREVDLDGLTASYEPREYVVQYHESDLDFVSRLLEAEGITYCFDHERGEGKEVMVLEDSNDNYLDVQTLDDNPELSVIADRADQAEVESLQYLDWTRELTSTAVHQRTFDWLTPIEPVEASAPAEGEADTDDRGLVREVYHHGRFVEGDPVPRTIRRLVHHRQRDKLARGYGNVTAFSPGRKFAVVDHQRPDMDQEYLLRRVVHTGDAPEVMMGEAGSGPRYQNRFECQVFTADQPYRPPRVTPCPRIYGPQTAIVTGPDGEEIHTDEHGRIKVRFDWDREHALTDDSSMWIRVAHNWAGPGFGTFFLPRVGMEVLVEFLEGNPAQPMVVGCVYNGDNQISVGVPDNKTQSTIRTKSSPDSDGYNELRFEDAAGSEEIFLHAQKDLTEKVENNHSTSVGADQSNTVGGNQSNTVDKDQTETITGKQVMTVTKTREKTVKQDETNKLLAKRDTKVGGDEKLEVVGSTTLICTGAVSETFKGGHKQTVTGASDISVVGGKGGSGDGSISADNKLEFAGKVKLALTQDNKATIVLEGTNATHTNDGKFSVGSKGDIGLVSETGQIGGQAAKKVTFTQGDAQLTIDGGKVSISSTSEVTISVGTNSIKIDTAGISINGAKVDVAAQAVASVTGAMVKIN